MFTSIRQAVVQPLARGFASQAPGAKRDLTPTIVLGSVLAIGGAYWFYQSDAGGKPTAQKIISKAEAAVSTWPADKPRPVALDKGEFRDFTITSVSDYNHNTKEYRFAFPDKEAVAGGPITHCIMVKAAEAGAVVDAKGKDIARPYTPTSGVDHVGELVLLIKKYDTGKLSPYLDTLKVGDKASFKGPFPKYKYEPSALERGIAIVGGSGVTPAYQLINHSLGLKDDTTKWTLIYSNVTEDDILLRKEWDALAASHPDRLTVVYSLDKPPKGWTGPTGYITPELVKKHAAVAAEAAGDKVKVFVCGPPGQVAAIAGAKDGAKQGPVGGALAQLGYTSEQVFKF